MIFSKNKILKIRFQQTEFSNVSEDYFSRSKTHISSSYIAIFVSENFFNNGLRIEFSSRSVITEIKNQITLFQVGLR